VTVRWEQGRRRFMADTVILSSSSSFTRECERCCTVYDNLHIAIAWCGNPGKGYGLPFAHLKRFKGKVVATVGRAFDQTHPDGIEFFRARKADLRIFRDGAVLFHPKVYLFSSADRVALFVGSSNFTYSGFYNNAEVNVLIEGPVGSRNAHRLYELRRQLKAWHLDPLSFVPTDAWLADYRKKFELNQQAQKRSPVQTPLQYEEQVPAARWLTNGSWDTYYQKVLDGLEEHERDKHKMLGFFGTVRKNLRLPWTVAYFDDLERRRIIGGYEPYGWFGHVGASGQFRHLLAAGTVGEKTAVVDVFNEIGGINPPVDWDRLGKLLDRLICLGPSMKVWGRLLCIVRPDLYCTVAAPSVRRQLSKVLEMPQSDFRTRQGYINVLRLIHASPWFQASRPKAPEAADIWKRRAAFLDAIFYE
jgi:hypothetical protein